ncbi:LysR substrate-binding domain-containing protein [Ottowia sp.]|uniref:LysR substrate-binding domain-containing protein n=1 Tax=Ottowia sp. TaxID=1898956 RepID=UPI00262D651F|nr:LysR substrate-binding domain-containing protein [Ottowia sp.]
MYLKQLEYFVRVAELGSFTRAAEVLGVAQPALSRQVRLLEVELRQNLLQRHGRGAVPTEAGELLLAHGRGILHQVERARDELAQLRGGLAGRVALGLPPSVARALTLPLIRAFRAELPDARLAITESLSASMQELLGSGRLDIAVLYNARPAHGIEIAPLGSEELMLVQPAGDGGDAAPLTLAEASRLPLVIPSRPNAIRMHVEAQMAAAGCQPTVALEIDSVRAILDLVESGAGMAILSRQTVGSAPRPDAFCVRRILMPAGTPLRIPLYTAVSALRPATATQQAVLALVRNIARERLDDL